MKDWKPWLLEVLKTGIGLFLAYLAFASFIIGREYGQYLIGYMSGLVSVIAFYLLVDAAYSIIDIFRHKHKLQTGEE